MGQTKKKQHYSGIGGQAVLEGVMMRNKNMYAVAVRKPDQEIEVEIDEFHGVMEDSVLRRIPFARGIFVFIDSMALGLRSLNFSASFYEDEESEPTKADRFLDRISGGNGEKVLMGVTTAISFLLAIAIFILLPYFISDFLNSYIRNASLMAIIEGVLRIAIFMIYIVAITAMKDIKRLYQYHGAEHKCINCIESGKPLTVDNARGSTRLHKRCGSSFILFVVFVSVILFFFIRVESPVLRIVIRIALIPVIAGISYELIRLAGCYDNLLVRIISAPGLWLQRLTTKEPDDSMLEVAIASVEAIFDWKQYLREEFGEQEQE
ncbi:MAG: DUF1385 domain-containing protein [Eubacteriales bacterium]|nr:DUF1385 domain-containing protein [Eubacteriales bacterium]